jgi:hypothetical protein
MAVRKLFLKEDFLEKLSDAQYEALFLLIRVLSALRLGQKSLYQALESQKFRNFEIIELNSHLLATYTECAKAYSMTISGPIYAVLGRDPDEFTLRLRHIYSLRKAEAPVEYRVLSFIRDTTTFHFQTGYMAVNRGPDGKRIGFMGLADTEGHGSVFLTNTIPHILEEIQKISGRDLGESTIVHYFKELNESLVYPFIEKIDELIQELVGKQLVAY